ncbi:unnamed protein product [Lactuca saligna]|uniref:Uncharacterized protein n=1 Tax=Lactuca saligna TaxID=75948 RepID=A0AA35VE37_LACSI|nr:unnamed protein product [Lactuca saligna]
MGGSFLVSPRKDTSIKSTFEETSNPDVNANVSNSDVNISSIAQQTTRIPEMTKVIPPRGLNTESNFEELKKIVVPLTQPSSLPLTSVTPISSIVVSTTFVGVMQEPIATLFSSESTEPEKTIIETNVDDDDVIVAFAKLQFNPKEKDIRNELIMLGKQFKILNSKMNSVLQLLANTGGKNYVSRVEFEYLLKAQESRLQSVIKDVAKKHENKMANQSRNFE